MNKISPLHLLALLLGLAALIFSCSYSFYLFYGKTLDQGSEVVTDTTTKVVEVVEKGDRLARDAGRAFERILNMTPRVSIKGDSVTLEKADIAELAVVARKTRHFIQYEATYLWKRKILIVSGDFIVKAGYDLNKPYHLQIDTISGSVTADFPEPEILSIDFQGYKVIHSDDSILNELTPKDHEEVVRRLIDKARRDAEASDIKRECKKQIQTRIEDLLSLYKDPIEFQFKGDVKRDAIP